MKNITIYSTPTCHYCNLAKAYFKAHNLQYTEHDVLADRSKLVEMRDLTKQLGVPVIRIGDAVTVGFREDIIEQMLAA